MIIAIFVVILNTAFVFQTILEEIFYTVVHEKVLGNSRLSSWYLTEIGEDFLI